MVRCNHCQRMFEPHSWKDSYQNSKQHFTLRWKFVEVHLTNRDSYQLKFVELVNLISCWTDATAMKIGLTLQRCNGTIQVSPNSMTSTG